MTDTLDALLAGGGKTAKFETIGTTHSGTITDVSVRQATNFDTGKPEFWDDGNAKQQIVVSIQTPERLDADDDGVRAIYINAWGEKLKAFRQAASEAKGKPEPGDFFTATYTGDGEKPQRGYAPKLFKYAIKKASPVDAVLGGATATASTVTAPPPAVPAATPPAAAPVASDERVVKLINAGLDDEDISSALDVPQATVQSIRVQQAALQGATY